MKSSHSKKKHKRKERDVDLEFSAKDAGVSVSDLSDSILRCVIVVAIGLLKDEMYGLDISLRTRMKECLRR